MVVSPEFVVILRFEDTENYENFHRASEGNEKGGEPRGGGWVLQKRRWRDNTCKIIGPQWSIQQEGGGGELIRRVP